MHRPLVALVIVLLAGACVPGSSQGPSISARALEVESSIGGIHWSPDGRQFAVVVDSEWVGTGRIDVFALDGLQKVATFPGWDVSWLDDRALAVYAVDPNAPRGWVLVHYLDGRPDLVLPGNRGGIIGNDRGRVASLPPSQGVQDLHPQITVLSNWDTSLSPDDPGFWSETEPIETGWPEAWTADGRFLASLTPLVGALPAALVTWRPESTPRVDFGAGAAPAASLSILRFPGATSVPVPAVDVDMRLTGSFSPDGRFLAGVSPLGDTLILDVTSGDVVHVAGSVPDGWTFGGDLVLVGSEDLAIQLWHPDGTVSDPGLRAGWASFGPLRDQRALIAQASDETLGGTVTVDIDTATLTLPVFVAMSGRRAVWAPDGSGCLVRTGTDDAQLKHDRLWWVSLP